MLIESVSSTLAEMTALLTRSRVALGNLSFRPAQSQIVQPHIAESLNKCIGFACGTNPIS